MKPTSIIKHLQRATLLSQGLSKTRPFGKGKKAVLESLEHLGYIQIDTLSVVARAHHHTLWTRIPDYKEEYLAQLTKERTAFEYWFHAAAFLPMQDYRFVLPKMTEFRESGGYFKNVDPKSLQYVYDKIKIDGPQKARDFKSAKQGSGSWWNWKPAKVALEKLFFQGDLMISGRDGMEKVYDLRERVLPSYINTEEPTTYELAEFLLKTHLRAYGFTSFKQATHLRRGSVLREQFKQVIHNLIEEKEIQEIKLEGMPPILAPLGLFDESFKKPSPSIRILSPFDNAIIHRDRIQQIFNFDYRLECYVPKDKRQFGYFTLPILFGDQFVGRVDCKAHRKIAELELISLYIEDEKVNFEKLLAPLVKAVKAFAKFNQCESIKVSQVQPKKYHEPLSQALA